MTDDAVNVKELLREKAELLNDIYDLTAAEDFSVMDEEKAERYANLYETREPMMECIAAIDTELAEYAGKSGKFGDGVAELAESVRLTAKKIYDLDKQYEKTAAAYAESIKKEIRSLKKGHAANVAYMTEVYSEGGTVLDKKN
jgi:hypothetical protein